jgi:predicted MFS family arabinose efflux permease
MRLSRPIAFYLQASIILFFLAGSSAPTPLYAVYQAAWGFSPITITIVFGIYAVAVLSMLLVVGSLSDYVGRRPVLLVATLVQAAAMLIFIHAHGVGTLVVARVVQGLATGAAAGAVGAGMLDIDRAKGTIANAIGPMLGTATGAIVGGVLVQFLPAPTQLVYIVLAVIYVIQFAGVLVMPDSVTPRGGALASLRPKLHVPAHLRSSLWLAAPALVAAWALAGFYGSLGPMLVRTLLASKSLILGGLTLGVLASSGALAVFVMRTRTARSLMTFGTAALVVGVALTLAAIGTGSAFVFFTGTVIAGAGFGGAFQGAIRTVLPLAAAHERAGVLSTIYLISYLALGLPAVLGGVRIVHNHDVFATAREYGVAVIVLATIALAGTLLRRPIAATAAPAH